MKVVKGLGLLIGLYLIVFFSVFCSSEKMAVNYSRPVDKVIAAADIRPVIPINYPQWRKGRRIIRVKLFHFEFPNNIYSVAEIEREMGLVGYRPANLEELIQYAESHPDLDERVTALGSSSINPDGFQKWPLLRLSTDSRSRYELAEIVESNGLISNDNKNPLSFLAVEK